MLFTELGVIEEDNSDLFFTCKVREFERASVRLDRDLADDFADSGYNLQRLITAIVSSSAYQLSSRWDQGASIQ